MAIEEVRPVLRRGGQRVLAVASGGGHWVQLRKLGTLLDEHDVAYMTVNEEYREEVSRARFYAVPDANLWNKLGLVRLAAAVLWVVLRERPDVVISTGAAPGFFALFWGKLVCGSRTIWVDSVANSERLSASGEKAGRFADLWLTQWEALSRPGGPRYAGRVF